MTRDFNKQRRDDVRPFSRDSSSNRYSKERSSRSPRPRLQRETIDRAWESGAPHDHADYRPRRDYGQSRSDNRRRDQYTDHPPASNKRGPSRPSDGQYRAPMRGPRRPMGPTRGTLSGGAHPGDDKAQVSTTFRDSRSSDTPRPPGNDRRYSDRFDRRPGSRSSSQGFRDDGREGYGGRSGRSGRPYDRERSQDRGDDRRGNRERRPHEFERDNRSPRNFERSRRPSRDREQYNEHPHRQERSRPMAQRDYPPRRGFSRDADRDEQFEGDYERFTSFDRRERQEGQGREERRVTHLPGERMPKGPQPAEREDAQFWREVEEDTEALVGQITPVPAEPGVPIKGHSKEKDKADSKPKRSRAAGVAGSKKAGAKNKAARVSSNGPKPSQKGFKWPKP